jgi:hypothetical protein
MGVCIHRHSVDCNEQVDGVDIRIDPVWPAAVKMHRLDDQVIAAKGSGNCYLASEEWWVNARNFDAPAPLEIPRFERNRRRPDFIQVTQFLGMALQWNREPTRFVKASEIFGDLPRI